MSLGIGVMTGMLCGTRGGEVLQKAIGKKIKDIRLDDEALHFEFADGTKMRLRDAGQSCCEHRYMTSDGDDLTYFIGHKLKDVELADAPSHEGEYGDCHDIQFMHVKTNKGTFTISSHNEHNGYYGGFWIVAEEE